MSMNAFWGLPISHGGCPEYMFSNVVRSGMLIVVVPCIWFTHGAILIHQRRQPPRRKPPLRDYGLRGRVHPSLAHWASSPHETYATFTAKGPCRKISFIKANRSPRVFFATVLSAAAASARNACA